MKPGNKHPVCPNCFGSEFRQVLATATSRNRLDDDPADEGSLDRETRRNVVKVLCAHCGHELHSGGNRG